MRRRRLVWPVVFAAAALSALGVFGASAAPPATADATAVTQWNLIAVSTLTGVPGPGLPGPAGGAPPASQINMGMVQGAVYDAVNAITPKHHRPYLLDRRFGNTASDEAAVATAAYLVLKNIVETVPQSITFPNRDTVLATLASQYQAVDERDTRLAVQGQGIAAGTAAAQAMIAARQGDGRFGPSQWVPNSAPGHWSLLRRHRPTTRLRGSAASSRSSWRARRSSAALVHLRSPAPPGRRTSTRSKRTAARATGSTRTASRRTSPSGGRATPSRAGTTSPASSSHGTTSTPLTPPASSRCRTWRRPTRRSTPGTTSTTSTSGGRGTRSVRAAEDGNDATVADPSWTALISAPYPDHVSGHLGLDGSHTGVLRMFFGDAPAGGYQITSASTLLTPGDPRRGRSPASRRRSTRSSRPASGRASTTAPRTCRP